MAGRPVPPRLAADGAGPKPGQPPGRGAVGRPFGGPGGVRGWGWGWGEGDGDGMVGGFLNFGVGWLMVILSGAGCSSQVRNGVPSSKMRFQDVPSQFQPFWELNSLHIFPHHMGAAIAEALG